MGFLGPAQANKKAESSGAGASAGDSRSTRDDKRTARDVFNAPVQGNLFGGGGRANRLKREHWRPLRLQFGNEEKEERGSNRNLSEVVIGGTNVSRAVGFGIRDTVRLLKSNDAHIKVPDNIGKWLVQEENLAMDPDGDPPPTLLYAGKISQRFKDRVISDLPCGVGFSCPFPLMFGFFAWSYYRIYSACILPVSLKTCDQTLLWHKKQYHRRTYIYIYHNRIEANYPTVRFPWGLLGCGSWNEDNVVVNHFDRGAFGFRQVPCGTPFHCCFVWEPFGEVAGRQRCPCNGPLVDGQGKLHCNQWCCDHWCCSVCCCHYQYPGLEDAAEFAVAADVALQAYFNRETLTKETFEERLDVELARRKMPPRQQYHSHDADDKWAYSRRKAAVAVAIGTITIALQITIILTAAFYLRFWIQRDSYATQAQYYATYAAESVQSATAS